MRDQTRQAGKQLGLGALNLVVAFTLVFLAARLANRQGSMLLGLLIPASVLFAVYLAGFRWIERRPAPELQARGSVTEFSSGLAIGIGLFSAVMALLWIFGVYHPTGWGTASALASGGLAALCEAVLEEVIFRAFLFRLFSLATGTWVAVLLTSALFGAAHAANPGATLYSSIAIAVEAGVILAAAYAMTGRLWLPIGLHAGWNFAEGSLFGMSVSGTTGMTPLSTGTLVGPRILTGGQFGPEASIVAVLACLAVGIILLWRTVRLGKIQPPMWRHRAEASAASPAAATR